MTVQVDPQSDNLLIGGVYSTIARGSARTEYILAKVLQVKDDIVHLVILPETYKKRPLLDQLQQDGVSLCLTPNLAKDFVDAARERHVALTRKLFALLRPVFVAEAPISDLDRAGMTQWLLLNDKTVVEAPATIQSEDNRRVYLRIFLLCGLPFGLLQGGYHLFKDGPVVGVFAFLFGFVLFGLGMALSQYLAIRRRLGLKVRDNLPEHSLSAYQVEELELPFVFARAFELCGDAIRTIKNVKVLEEDLSGGCIEAEVGFSLSAEGEYITICLYRISNELTGVVVASVPRANGEVDMGKNFENVTRVAKYLRTVK